MTWDSLCTQTRRRRAFIPALLLDDILAAKERVECTVKK